MTRFQRWRAKRRLKQQLYDEYVRELRNLFVAGAVNADKRKVLDQRHRLAARREALLDSRTNIVRNLEDLNLPPEAFIDEVAE